MPTSHREGSRLLRNEPVRLERPSRAFFQSTAAHSLSPGALRLCGVRQLGRSLGGRFSALDTILSNVVADLFTRWQKSDGSFRARELLMGWDNVPMHRWAQAQIFRSLCFLLSRTVESPRGSHPILTTISREVLTRIDMCGICGQYNFGSLRPFGAGT